MISLVETMIPFHWNLDPAFNKNQLFKEASSNGNLKLVKYLVSLKSKFPKIHPAEMNNASLRYAAKNGHLDIVQFLVSLKPQFSDIAPEANKK